MGQDEFEILIDYQGDTMLRGMHALESNDGSVFLLNNVYLFDPTIPPDGIPIEGYPSFGFGISKIDKNGLINFNIAYLNHFYGVEITSANKFYFNSQNDIIIPYLRYVGLFICPEGGAFPSEKKSVFKVSQQGEVLDYNDPALDANCSLDIIFSTGFRNDDNVIFFRTNLLEVPYLNYYDIFNQDLELVLTDTFFNVFGAYYDRYLDLIISGNQSGIKIYSFNDELIDEFQRPPIQLFSVRKRDVLINENYYAVVTGGKYNSNDSTYVTDIYIMDKQGNLIAEKIIDGIAYDKGVLGPDNVIYLLADNSHYDNYDALALPVKVAVLDFDLNILGEKDFGFPFVSTNSITATQDGFLVSGVRYKSYDIVNGKEKDQAYILKGTLDQLVGVKGNKIEKPDISIYPNPSNDYFLILSKSNNQVRQVEIKNLAGQLVIQLTPRNNRVNISDLKPGIYLVTVETNKGIVTKKLIKQ